MPRKKRKYEEYMTLGYTADGKRIRRYISSDSQAEFNRLKRDAQREADKIRNPSHVSIGEYADRWLEIYKSNRSAQTYQQYDYAVKKLNPIYHKELQEVTASDLQALINRHRDHPRSCQVLKLALSQMYKQAIRDGIIYPVNLAEDLTIPQYDKKEKKIITDTQMDALLASDLKPQDRLYAEVLRHTGMRPSEALALQWADIDYDRLEITVRRSFAFDGSRPIVKTTKTNQIRTIPITSEFAATLRQSATDGLYIFTCEDGRPMTKNAYRRMSERILKGTDLTMYSFRHTFATRLYYDAVKPGIISALKAAQIMGHSEQVYLRTYTHIEDGKEQMDALREALAGRPKGDQKETSTTEKVAGRPKGDHKNEQK